MLQDARDALLCCDVFLGFLWPGQLALLVINSARSQLGTITATKLTHRRHTSKGKVPHLNVCSLGRITAKP
jgi:hypothetical protein